MKKYKDLKNCHIIFLNLICKEYILLIVLKKNTKNVKERENNIQISNLNNNNFKYSFIYFLCLSQ